MRYLVIDTPCPRGQLLVATDRDLQKRLLLDLANSTNDLPKTIVDLAKETGIEAIAYSRGPGAFSSLRQGAIIAAMTAKLLNIKLFCYSTLLAQVPRELLGNFEAFIDARGGRSYRAIGTQTTDSCLLDSADLVDIPSPELQRSPPEQILFLVVQEIKNSNTINPNQLLIDYIKEV